MTVPEDDYEAGDRWEVAAEARRDALRARRCQLRQALEQMGGDVGRPGHPGNDTLRALMAVEAELGLGADNYVGGRP